MGIERPIENKTKWVNISLSGPYLPYDINVSPQALQLCKYIIGSSQ